MNHVGLFEGIGGFSLAASWMGWETVAWCEINEFCQKILKQHFPNATGYGDIKETNFNKYKGTVDIVTGGFPCQPHSAAGSQLGDQDERDLWSECVRAVNEIRPRYALFENVPGLLNSNGGRFFNRVLSDLAKIGYNVEWCCLPASAIGAPHIRERVWIISYPNSNSQSFGIFNRDSETTTGRNQNTSNGDEIRNKSKVGATIYSGIRINKEWLPEPDIPKLVNGLPGELDRIKALGNAIVPQVAFEIFKAIEQYEQIKTINT